MANFIKILCFNYKHFLVVDDIIDTVKNNMHTNFEAKANKLNWITEYIYSRYVCF